MAAGKSVLPCSLLDLLSNSLILRHTSPYIGIRSLVSLAATSKAYKSLMYDTPHVFQHVDLRGTHILARHVGDVSIDDQKIDEFYAQRFSTILSMLENRNVVQDVRTLVLDELYVPTTILEDILCNERYQIRLLSIRGSHKINKQDVFRILRHLVKPSRPEGAPKLRALYVFGPQRMIQEVNDRNNVRNRPKGVTATTGARLGAGDHGAFDLDDFRKLPGEDPYSDSPYGALGMSNILAGTWAALGWPEILEACAGLIAFDAVLCRHDRANFYDRRPRLATVRLDGCKSCGTCPEGPAYPGVSPADRLPLLSPPPLHSSKVEVAQRIGPQDQPYPPLIVRCRTCLKGRWCEMCNVWWCESCYTTPKNRGSTKGDPASSVPVPALNEDIKVHNGLCVSDCLMHELLNGVGEGGMWG